MKRMIKASTSVERIVELVNELSPNVGVADLVVAIAQKVGVGKVRDALEEIAEEE